MVANTIRAISEKIMGGGVATSPFVRRATENRITICRII